MWGDIQAGIPLGILLAFVVGPVFFVVLETAALRGVKSALLLVYNYRPIPLYA